ncbi:MAG: CBS domain-containing protein [Rhodothermales bacterium]|nr:CBS domain-containing protein [Rhodothermales bacterium]
MNTLIARDVMTTDVLAARDDWPVSRLAEFLTEYGISGAPVLDGDGRLVGVASMTDLVRHDALPEREPPRPGRQRAGDRLVLAGRVAEEESTAFLVEGGSETSVGDIMTPTVFTVEETTPLEEVAETMIRGRIHRVFVTRGTAIVGLVTALDLLKTLVPNPEAVPPR